MKLFVCLLSLISLLSVALCAVVPLPSYSANSESVSGFSSGAFMAVQYHVAYSGSVVGAAVFAGGPFDCAQGSITTAELTCMYAMSPPIPSTLIQLTAQFEQNSQIDPTANIKAHKVFMFSGTQDATVKQTVMDSLQQYYENYLPSAQIQYVNTMSAAHTFPTNIAANTNDCTTSAAPYLSNCNFDGAGAALQQIYGNLNQPNSSTPTGEIINFDQTAFGDVNSLSLDTSGYVYVPKSCATGTTCKLHLALHGCLQYAQTVGTVFVTQSGYLPWADANDIIVVFPQTVATSGSNPNGCWNWWGYSNDASTYQTNQGGQMQFLSKIMAHVSGKSHA